MSFPSDEAPITPENILQDAPAEAGKDSPQALENAQETVEASEDVSAPEVVAEVELPKPAEETPVEISGQALEASESSAEAVVSPEAYVAEEAPVEEVQAPEAEQASSEVEAPVAQLEEPAAEVEAPLAQAEEAASEVETPVAQAEEAPVEAVAATEEVEAVAEVDQLPETSLNEEVDEQAETEAAKEEDFNALSRRDMIRRLQEMSQQPKISDPLLRKLKAAYDDQFELERTAALNQFKEEGGIEEDFEFRKDAEAIEFEQLFRMVREKRKQQLEEVDKTKRINLKQKQQLIEDLKALNDQEESTGSLEEIKRIMERWRSIGPVPHTDAQELFKNFDFQVDKFYSRRTEFFEMKELDRKRNLERKTALLERAKKTLDEPVFVNGLREYNKIYEEFRHTGPAPKEENERLYTEIKAIGTQLHERKKSYDEAQRAEAEKVAAIRQGLLVQMDVVSGFTSETIAEWQTQTDLVQKLIGEWKGAGSRFRDQDPDVSKRFWSGLKKFYAAKDAFFKKLDKERGENLAQKREILAKVQELVAGENKFKAQSELNQLVAAWKEVGPVAYKDRDKLNKEFSKALDSFYEAKRSSVSAEQTEQRDNLAKKQALVDRLNALSAEKKGDEEEFREIQREFNAVGFVPFKKKDEINAAFKDALVKAIEQTTEIAQGQKAFSKLEVIRGGGGGRGGRAIGAPMRKEGMGQRGILNKRIAGLETDVRNYKNNMDFISNTKNGEKLKAEFNDRIAKAEEEINLLRQQMKELERQEREAKNS